MRSKSSFLPSSLYGQLILFLLLSLSAAVLGFGVFNASRQAQLAFSSLNGQVSALAKNLATVSANYILTGDLSAIEEVATQTINFPGIHSILITDEKGAPLSEVANEGEKIKPRYSNALTPTPPANALLSRDSVPPAMFDIFFSPETIEKATLWRPVSAGKLLGWVRVTYSLRQVRESIVLAWLNAAFFSVLALACATLLLTLLLRQPMRALRSATQFAMKLDAASGTVMPVSTASTELQALTVALNDVSVRLHTQERTLLENSEYMRTILDNMMDGIVTFDSAGIVQSFNHSATKIFGFEAAEAVGFNINMLVAEHHIGNHGDDDKNDLRTVFFRGTDKTVETEGQRKTGDVFTMEISVSQCMHRGQPLYICLVRDLTERKKLGRMKSEFISIVSHELRTPLTAISGSLGLILGGAIGHFNEKAAPMLDMAYRNCQRLIHLVNDLLDMEKLESGKMSFDLHVQELMPVVEQAIESMRDYGSQHQVIFQLTERIDGLMANVDVGRLQQVLTNFLSNAAKFSPSGSQVEITVRQRGELIRVSVIDHGAGIPSEFKNHIFQKFAQADSSNTRQKGGTGLGLSISKEMMEQMGGSVGFESQEGQGSIFYLEIPAAIKD